MRTLLLALALVASLGQTPTPTPYTEVETLRIENIALEGALIQRQLTDWQAKRAKLKADIEAARPGLTWDVDTGKFAPKPK